MNNITKNTVLAAIVAGAVLLAGCTATDTAPTDPKPAATQPAETPTEEKPVTVDGVVALEAGTTLTDEQAAAIKREKTAKAYTLPSGEKVLVKKNEKLPKAVEEAEAKKLAEVEMPTSSDQQHETFAKLDSAASSASFATGKRACVVMQAEYANPEWGGPDTILQWVANGCPLEGGTIPSGVDKAAVVAEAKARIAKQSNPDEWALIIEK